jgi:hypothetical protein
MGENSAKVIRHLLGLDDPLDREIALRVQPISHGGFGVYANMVLIAIYSNKADADVHCQRLLNQQAHG